MQKIPDYINESKNKSFKELKFNEVDALIFTLISYIDFSKIAEERITLKDAYEKVIRKKLLKTKDGFNIKNRELLKLMASTPRYQNIYLEKYQKITNHETQFGAITIRVPHEFVYVAFEGTDDLLVGWEEDLKLSYTYPVPAQKSAYEYLNKVIKFSDILVYVGGHSKGGNLAVTALMEANFNARLRVKYAFNFDGPGFLPEQVNSQKYQRIQKKLRHYYPEESVVGMILENKGKEKFIKSSSHLVNQHNAHNWKIKDNRFEEGKKSEYSKTMHKKFQKLIKDYSKEDREKFVKIVFNLLYKSGYNLKSELKELNLNKFKTLVKETKLLKADEKKLILEVLKSFVVIEK